MTKTNGLRIFTYHRIFDEATGVRPLPAPLHLVEHIVLDWGMTGYTHVEGAFDRQLQQANTIDFSREQIYANPHLRALCEWYRAQLKALSGLDAAGRARAPTGARAGGRDDLLPPPGHGGRGGHRL